MVQTTIMRNSQVGDAWINQVCVANPPQYILDAKGQSTGNILTGPVRLAFTDAIFEQQSQMKDDPNSKMAFGCTLLFTPYSTMTVLWETYCRIAQSDFPQNNWNDISKVFNGLVPPWRDQGEKPQFEGFTPGCPFMNVKSNYKPAVVDLRMNPIVDQSQIYPGCWAIVALQPFAGGKSKPKRGPMWGLQNIMKIADDTNLGGAGLDSRLAFGGVKGLTPPTGGAAQAFGQLPSNQPPLGQQTAMGQVYGQPAMQEEPFDISKFS